MVLKSMFRDFSNEPSGLFLSLPFFLCSTALFMHLLLEENLFLSSMRGREKSLVGWPWLVKNHLVCEQTTSLVPEKEQCLCLGVEGHILVCICLIYPVYPHSFVWITIFPSGGKIHVEKCYWIGGSFIRSPICRLIPFNPYIQLPWIRPLVLSIFGTVAVFRALENLTLCNNLGIEILRGCCL